MKSFKKMIATVLCVAMIMGALNITDVGNPCISTEAAGATKVSSDASGNVSGEASAEASGEASADASGDEAGNVGSGKKSTKVKATKKQTLNVGSMVGYTYKSVFYGVFPYYASDLKKKTKKFKISATTNISSGNKFTYKVVTGKKYIKVSKKGKVTIKKGCKAGQYKIKVSAPQKGKYKKAVCYAVVYVIDSKKIPLYVTYKGKTLLVDDAKSATSTECTTTDALKAWGKPTKIIQKASEKEHATSSTAQALQRSKEYYSKYYNTSEYNEFQTYWYDVQYKKGKCTVTLIDQYRDGKFYWETVGIGIKDKNMAIDGVKVGMSKAQVVKKLKKLYGKNNLLIGDSNIMLFYNLYMPSQFEFDKKGKLKSFSFWHS